jgi:hypothetical protein
MIGIQGSGERSDSAMQRVTSAVSLAAFLAIIIVM